MRKNARTEDLKPEENINHFPLDEIVKKGAKRMLEQALETEVDSFLERHQYLLDDQGRRLVIRNGYAKERKIVTGAGQLGVRTPRVDDRILETLKEDRFQSSLIPPYCKIRSNSSTLSDSIRQSNPIQIVNPIRFNSSVLN